MQSSILCRAKNIKNTALVNKDMSEKALLSSYQAEIKKLKQKLQERLLYKIVLTVIYLYTY